MGFVLFVGLLVLIRATLLPELGGPRPPRFPECESEKDIPACVSLKKRFYDGCMRCHGSGYHLRAAPDLVDLLGREREFDTGVTLVADEAYIRSLSHSAPELRRTPYLSTFSDLRQGV
jgi:hypothetical protein